MSKPRLLTSGVVPSFLTTSSRRGQHVSAWAAAHPVSRCAELPVSVAVPENGCCSVIDLSQGAKAFRCYIGLATRQ